MNNIAQIPVLRTPAPPGLGRYVASLDAQQRADLAVCHVYIAQALLYDDFAALPIFCAESATGKRKPRRQCSAQDSRLLEYNGLKC